MGLFIVREGYGEEGAMSALVRRLSDHLGLHAMPYVPKEGDWRKPLVTEAQVRAACELARGRTTCQALLLTRDADLDYLPEGDCPRVSAPQMATWVRGLGLPFPTAVVLFYKEYETLFVAGAKGMAGKDVRDKRGNVVATIPNDAVPHTSPEYPRDAKGWVGKNLLPGYKTTLFQASLTRLLDLNDSDTCSLSSYRRLGNALTFLSHHLDVAGAVYPPSIEGVDA